MTLFKIRHLITLPALLNIAGIAIAVAAFYILMAVADYDLNFNKGIKDCERVYNFTWFRTDGTRTNLVTRPFGELLGKQFPSVESYGCLWPWLDYSLYLKRNGEYQQVNFRTGGISKGLINTFDLKIIDGDTTKFKTLNQIMISRQNAEKYGIELGEYIKYDLNVEEELEVVAIYDIPSNTELQPFGGFRCMGNKYINDGGWLVTSYYYKMSQLPNEETFNKNIFLLMKQIYNLPDVGTEEYNKLPEEQQMLCNESVLLEKTGMRFIPLNKIHYEPEIEGFHEPGNIKVSYTLLILAVVIVLIAYINYINFFFARVPQRVKSLNTMMIFGSSRKHLVTTLVSESLVFTFVSMVLAFVLVYTVAPMLLGGTLDMNTMVYSNYKMLILSILLPILTSIAVSIYPALRITNISPALALKGSITQHHDFALRYILIGFQITASTALIIVSMFIHRNIDYITHNDLGFNTQNLFAVETSQRISESRDEVRSLLLQNPDITDITWTHSELIARIRHNLERVARENIDSMVKFDVIFVADNFFDFMDLDIVEGRGFLPSDHLQDHGVFIFNQHSRDHNGLKLGYHLQGLENVDDWCEIVGFCKDIKFKPLQYAISPLAFNIPGKHTPGYASLKQLYIRIADNANVKKTKRFIYQTLAQIDPNFPAINHPIKTFQDEMMDSNYHKETELTRMISLFAFIAILISVMGIFGIVYFETERRRKEIGIRRVNGATIWEILSLFNVKFLKISAICSLVAIPIAYFFVQKYFSGFVYHYPINIWVFVMATILSISVTLLVVTAASFRAASENPVNTLRNDE